MTRTWWQLSFADPRRPRGYQWLGGVNTEAASIQDAITWTHVAGINPGGDVAFLGIFSDIGLDPNYVDRLITDETEWRNQPVPPDAKPILMPYPAINGFDAMPPGVPLTEKPPGQ
jgi:hypothetical protein